MPKYVPRLEVIMHSHGSGRALCFLTLGHISAYNMDNTILLYEYWIHNIESEYSMEYDPIRFSTANIIVSGTVLFQFVVIVIDETFCIDAFMYASYWLFTYSFVWLE